MFRCCVAGLYDPATNVWSSSALAPTGELAQVTAVWTGATIVVAGVREDGHVVAATYNPADDHWSRIDPSLPVGHPALGVALATASDRVILWSMWGRTVQTGASEYTGCSGIDVYRGKTSPPAGLNTNRCPRLSPPAPRSSYRLPIFGAEAARTRSGSGRTAIVSIQPPCT